MKIKKLKKIIIINLIFISLLLTLLISIVIFILNLNNIAERKIKKTNSQIAKIQSENKSQIKHYEKLTKYSEKWALIPNKSKKIQTTRPSEFNSIINNIAQKYYISNLQLSLKLPERLKGKLFKKKSIAFNLVSGTLSFYSSDDIRSLRFLNEFFNNLPGDIIIESITIAKTHDYTNEDYLSISKKGFILKIKTKIIFSWYSKRKLSN